MTRTAIATDEHGRHPDVRVVGVASSDTDISDLLEIHLEGLDLACHRVEDGEHVVALCRERKPQVLLLDMQVQGMAALDVIRAIRSDPALSGVRIILLACGSDQAQLDEALAAGAETSLVSVSWNELLELFRGR